jgi:hypothetical protein
LRGARARSSRPPTIRDLCSSRAIIWRRGVGVTVLRCWEATDIALRRSRLQRWRQQRDILYDGEGSGSGHGGREDIMTSLVSAM